MPHSDPPAAEPSNNPASSAAMEVEPTLSAASSSPADEDFVMIEAGEVQGVVEEAAPAAEPPSAQAEADEDMKVEIQQEKRPETKLEDLFAGMDSDDDEFSTPVNAPNGQQQESRYLPFQTLPPSPTVSTSPKLTSNQPSRHP